jgi:hypothetical protein
MGHSMLEVCKNILKIVGLAGHKAAELELCRTSRRVKILLLTVWDRFRIM